MTSVLRLAVAVLAAATLAVPMVRADDAARLPAEVVDAFHAALERKDTAGALSLLDRGVVVFEAGTVDSSATAYALSHLRTDIDLAVATDWTLLTRRLGGDGEQRWVLSTYKVVGRQADGSPIDHVALETVILRKVGAAFRIAHLHWSTDRERPAAAPAASAAR